MIDLDKKTKIIELIVADEELTTKKLKEIGLTSKDLTTLVNENYLIREKRGLYRLANTEDLFAYAKKVLASKNKELANKLFAICHQINPSNIETNTQLFYNALTNTNYEEAFYYFDLIYKESQTPNNNLYLLLLSDVMTLPNEYKQILDNLTYQDIMIRVEGEIDENIVAANRVRTLIFNRKFKQAAASLKNITNAKKKVHFQELILSTLLKKVIRTRIDENNQLAELIKSSNSEEVVNLLDSISSRRRLTIFEDNIRILSQDLIEIRTLDSFDIPQGLEMKSLTEAIDKRDYVTALDLVVKFNQENKVPNEESFLYIILLEINKIIEELTKEEVKEEPIKAETNSTEESNNIDYLNIIISKLLEGNVQEASKYIELYLKLHNKSQYNYLINYLIKISVKEKDLSFHKPIIYLINFSNPNYKLDITPIIKELYIALTKDVELASIYLEIIERTNQFLETKIPTEPLRKTIESIKGIETSTIEYVEPVIEDTTEKKFVTNEPEVQTVTNVKDVQPVAAEQEDYSTDLLYVEQLSKELTETEGIKILRPMSDERRKNIHRIVKNTPNISSFSIFAEPKRSIVLRYTKKVLPREEFMDLVHNANETYKQKRYTESAYYFEELVKLPMVRSENYAKLGLLYIKLNRIEDAITCLTIAEELSKTDNKNFEFGDLILNLQGGIPQEDRKPKVKMRLEDFSSDQLDTFEIPDNDNLLYLITEEKIPLLDACERLGFTEEETAITLLIYAKEAYTIENYTLGDKILKLVEKLPVNNKRINKLITEIRKGKIFYKNRKEQTNFRLMKK